MILWLEKYYQKPWTDYIQEYSFVEPANTKFERIIRRLELEKSNAGIATRVLSDQKEKRRKLKFI